MSFLQNVIIAVIIQITGVLGLFFVFAFILSKLQTWTLNQYQKTVGWKGILWTAWIGTPIHELGHIFFIKIFRHKITNVALFRPNESSGELGSVDHTYKIFSLYQRIGNFFIGSAPLFFGSAILALLVYVLVPNGKEIFAPLRSGGLENMSSIFLSIKNTLFVLFDWKNVSAWNFWLFLYVSFCIASHLAPSAKDRNGMWRGFFWIILILLIINILFAFFHRNPTTKILLINQYLGVLVAIFLYATLVSLLHFIFSCVILSPFKRKY